jgi:hypothetical protein
VADFFKKAPKVLRTFLMLLLIAPFFEVHESMFVSVKVEHTFNDACENAGHTFRSHVEQGSRTNQRKAENRCTLRSLKPTSN